MSMNAATPLPAQAQSHPGTPSPAPAGKPTDGAFDRRLDDARRQQRDTPTTAQEPAQAKAAAPGKAGDAAAPAKDAPAADGEAEQGDGDAGLLAAAVLALLGQSVPAARAVAAAPAAADAGHAHDKAAPGAVPGGLPVAAGLPAPPSQLPGLPVAPEGLMNAAVQPERLTLPEHEPGDMQALPVASLPAAVAHAAVPDAHVLGMTSAAGTPAFAQELGQQVAWLGGQELKQARIRLHPEEFGQLDVKVSVTHGQVDVTFAVQHPAAVHAVQQTLAQLDTLLAQHGLSLGHAEVGQQQARGEQSQGRSGGGNALGGDDDMGLAAPVSPAPAALGLLDTFA
ncbi:flagellar hook-length control protein FliK [Frateuria sp. Soil773]|uniref:flagellar hook-length control protein FliK n=1 Tax=Frateuria sp. Soil773 TaxID=1736407 RepID=UPI00138F874A|nr:flagellar hook-length control protein FliK [Frateuria sp. Soil773]